MKDKPKLKYVSYLNVHRRKIAQHYAQSGKKTIMEAVHVGRKKSGTCFGHKTSGIVREVILIMIHTSRKGTDNEKTKVLACQIPQHGVLIHSNRTIIRLPLSTD